MKIGDKVICIGNKEYSNSIKKYEKYEVIQINYYENTIKIKNEIPNQIRMKFFYPRELFLTIEQFREYQINKILI